jgi:hypothetical protein
MTQPDLRAQLDDVEDQIRTLRGETGGLTDQTGGDADGPQDPEDTAAALTNAEENGALIDALEGRRRSLLSKLSQDD